MSSLKKLHTKWNALGEVVGEKVIGRVYTVHPSAGEVFYLRTLLHHLTGRDLALADAPPADDAVVMPLLC